MTMSVLITNGSIVPLCTFVPMTIAELNHSDRKRQLVIFDNLIIKTHGDSMNLPPWVMDAAKTKKPVDQSFIPYEDEEEELWVMAVNNCSVLHISLVNVLVNTEVLLPQGEESNGYENSNLVKVKVIRHFCDEDGNIIGNVNIRPQLNTLMYEVEFPDGKIKPYAANIIAKTYILK